MTVMKLEWIEFMSNYFEAVAGIIACTLVGLVAIYAIGRAYSDHIFVKNEESDE